MSIIYRSGTNSAYISCTVCDPVFPSGRSDDREVESLLLFLLGAIKTSSAFFTEDAILCIWSLRVAWTTFGESISGLSRTLNVELPTKFICRGADRNISLINFCRKESQNFATQKFHISERNPTITLDWLVFREC